MKSTGGMVMEWPVLKKALWEVVVGSELNAAKYVNAWGLTEKLYSAALRASPSVGRWLPIEHADKTIVDIQTFAQVGITLRNSERFWVRDADGRTYEASWSESDRGMSYWWDWDGESPVDPVEFMPHPLDPRWASIATTECKDNA